jgi:hypothetical protein
MHSVRKGIEIRGGIRHTLERRIGKVAQHEAENVLLANAIERLPRQSLALGAVFAGDVAEDDLGVRGLLGLVDATEPVDTLVGNLDGSDVHSPPNPVGTPRPVSVLKTVVFPEPAKPTRPTFMRAPRPLRDRERVSTSCARCQTLVRPDECPDRHVQDA